MKLPNPIDRLWVEITSLPRYGLSLILVGLVLTFFISPLYGVPLVMIGIGIRIKQMERTGPDKYELRRAKVDGKVITTCQWCPHCEIKENVWSKSFPTFQCLEKGGKYVYVHGIIPRWCPYALPK